MSISSAQFASKVHPLDRELLADDPMELMAESVMGDPTRMLECMIQEFLWMGWSADRLFGLFESPEYPMLQDLLSHFGAERVRLEIDDLLARLGGVTFTATVDETPEADEDDHEPERIQLTVRRRESDLENDA